MKLELSGKIFEKYSNSKFHANVSSGGHIVACGQTDRQTDGHDEANSHFLQFCQCAYKTAVFKKSVIITII
jgi:hypothetical protein